MISERPDVDGHWSAKKADVMAYMMGLRDLPDPLPILMCKGLCSHSCGPAPMTPVEAVRVEGAIGRRLEVRPDLSCSALNDEGRCDAYAERPLICRLWGMAEGMMCRHGCVTTNGLYLTYPEVAGLIAQAEAAEGEMLPPPLAS